MTSVEEKLATYPELLAKRLSQVRTLVQEIATTTKSIGTLEENLKWGQISIATVRPKTGTPIRIDGNMDAATYSIYMPCSSNLIEGFRTLLRFSWQPRDPSGINRTNAGGGTNIIHNGGFALLFEIIFLPPFFTGEVPKLLRRRWGLALLCASEFFVSTIP